VARRPALFLKILICAAAVIALLVVAHGWWMTVLGRLLVHDDGPARADIAVVLAGDYYGNRVLRAAELVRQGYVPDVLVSGPHLIYGKYECDLEIPFAVEHGFPESWFIRVPNETQNTRDEATSIVAEMHRRGIHRFLLVTSNFHTARAARIYRVAAPELQMRVVAAPDKYFRPDGWWRNREAQKIFLIEWLKTAANAVGL
jgi:uncharacterized SAM-binding protein YcdF (DUF218 family)